LPIDSPVAKRHPHASGTDHLRVRDVLSDAKKIEAIDRHDRLRAQETLNEDRLELPGCTGNDLRLGDARYLLGDDAA
jgi:hypothetical protein